MINLTDTKGKLIFLISFFAADYFHKYIFGKCWRQHFGSNIALSVFLIGIVYAREGSREELLEILNRDRSKENDTFSSSEMVSIPDDAYGIAIGNLTENGDLYFSTHVYSTERAADEFSLIILLLIPSYQV